MLLLQTHYRSPVKVGQDNIDAAVNSLAGLDGFANRMANASLPIAEADATVIAQFRTHMDNDIDTPSAMAVGQPLHELGDFEGHGADLERHTVRTAVDPP
jgi:cysteinyl-tRNA synthetase